jgi:acyl carrier protein
MSSVDQSMQSSILIAIKEATGRPLRTDIDPNTSVYDLGIDSMSLVEMIFKLEADLGIDIPLAELNENIFQSLDSLGAYLSSRKNAAAETSAMSAVATAR